MWSACRIASETIVRVGLQAAPVVNWLPSEMNRFLTSWAWPNLFTTGAACNPTLTIVSLAIRQADHIAGAMQRKEI